MKNKSEICRCLLFEAAVWSCCQVSIRGSRGTLACAMLGQGLLFDVWRGQRDRAEAPALTLNPASLSWISFCCRCSGFHFHNEFLFIPFLRTHLLELTRGSSHFLILLVHREISFWKPGVVGENGRFWPFLVVLVLFKGERTQEKFRQTPSDTFTANL